MSTDDAFIRRLYAGFNARDVDAVLALLAPEVAWANGMEGGHVHGREAVRSYWTRQWTEIDPHVEPEQVSPGEDGSMVVAVRQVVRDLDGHVLLDERVQHVFRIADGLVTRFDILEAGRLSSVVRGT